ncbi:MAG: tRNA (adenosine(37)-N6)-threonylcarbamoyltransferase complex dimerization subunit type 1 TsaB [Bacteroidota bacterium]
MPYLLHIETSSKICSVAISKNDMLIDLIEDPKENSHAAKLTSLIETIVNKAKITYNDISAISFSSGPGSYTGLRIGLSTAKGLCYALNIPLIFVNTLEAMLDEMIYQYPIKEAVYMPMIDARRMEVYTLQADFNKNIILPIQALILTEVDLDKLFDDRKIVVAGDANKKAQSLINIKKNIIYLEIENSSSTYLIRKAYEKFRNKNFEEVAYCEPFYLKNPNHK